jgi:hypothetical protein
MSISDGPTENGHVRHHDKYKIISLIIIRDKNKILKATKVVSRS